MIATQTVTSIPWPQPIIDGLSKPTLQPSTIIPQPALATWTLNSQSQSQLPIFELSPQTFNLEPWTLTASNINYTLNPESLSKLWTSKLSQLTSIVNPKPSNQTLTRIPQSKHYPSTLNPRPSTLKPQPSALNLQPSTLNPQPSTLNPHEYFFLHNSRNVLPTFRSFCPDWVWSAQMGSNFAHFQVQARLAARHAVTVSLHAVKLLYTATFQWGLKVTTHCCVVVHQCFLRDQPDTTEISQIQLTPAVTSHGGRLSCYWGPTACREQCTIWVSWNTNPVDAATSFLISYRR